MPGKRARSTCSISRSSTPIEANRPAKRQACAIEAVTPPAGRSCEGYTIIFWIHWREINPEDGEVYWRMEELDTARMSKLDDLVHMRNMLHNYLDYALGERLSSIKKALPAFWPNRPEKRVNSTRSQSSATGSELRLDMLLTPSTSAGESACGDLQPRKKTKRSLTDMFPQE